MQGREVAAPEQGEGDAPSTRPLYERERERQPRRSRCDQAVRRWERPSAARRSLQLIPRPAHGTTGIKLTVHQLDRILQGELDGLHRGAGGGGPAPRSLGLKLRDAPAGGGAEAHSRPGSTRAGRRRASARATPSARREAAVRRSRSRRRPSVGAAARRRPRGSPGVRSRRVGLPTADAQDGFHVRSCRGRRTEIVVEARTRAAPRDRASARCSTSASARRDRALR